MFGDNTIDVVDDYVYLGTTFNYNCLFHKAKNKLIALIRRASYSLLQKIIKYSLPFDICLDLYDKLIIPIMLYGCEVWGYENNQQLLVTCNSFLKRILKLNKSTPTCMLYGEIGFTNPPQLIDNRLINIWYSIANGSDSKISSILYKFIKSVYDLNVYKSP